MRKVGLALGGGGAKGLAHLLVFEALEEMGVRPWRIAGTSMGAVLGAIYASGVSANAIRKEIDRLVSAPLESVRKVLFRADRLRFINLIDPHFGRGGLLKGERFVAFLYEMMRTSTFENLVIPLKVVAADFWRREEVVLDSGPLLPAIRASMALPGLFTPVRIDGRLLVDGALVNPVPYDILQDECKVVIAVDVLGQKSEAARDPSLMDAVFNAYQILEETVVRQKMARRPPGIYLRPAITDVRILEFHKAHEIFRQAAPIKEQLKRELAKQL